MYRNRLVAVHPSLSKGKGTRSATAFGNEGIEGAPHWIKAAKDAILAAEAFSMVFSYFRKCPFDRGLHDVKYKPY